jgi:hypothetical protein
MLRCALSEIEARERAPARSVCIGC